jgi:hypothetical protein
MTTRRLILILIPLLAPIAPAAGQVPTPASVIGWEPGEDYKLADYGQISEYFRQLDAASDRIRLTEIGRTAEGRPMMLAFISSEENLRELDRYREISRRLALARDLDEPEARALAEQGRAIVWIDGGLHATEVAHAQHTPVLAHHLVTSEDPEVERIRREVIILLMPVMNPDGLEITTAWYRRNVGTEFEVSPLPELYQKYVGHDNNRDWYMILQPETRAVANQLYHEWFPQIVYNHHQTGPIPSRIFIPPFKDPMNPNIPPLVMRGINLVGSAMGFRFAQERKPGAVSRVSYDVWWNGGMRSTPYYHNMVGILTETNLYRYATPHYYEPDSLPSAFREGLSGEYPSVFYPDPWRGGWWRIRDAMDYMMTASMAVADIGALRRREWLYNMYQMGRDAIEAGERGGPFAYVIPPDQWDAGEAVELVNVLRRGAVEIHRATAPFTVGGVRYPAGSYVAFAAQPFRAHLVDLMEPQRYPDKRIYPGGPPDPPYDMTGWTLPIQMGVRADRIEQPFEMAAEPVRTQSVSPEPGQVRGRGPVYLLSPNGNASFRAVNRLLAAGSEVTRASRAFRAAGADWPAGTFLVRADAEAVRPLAEELGLDFAGVRRPNVPATVLAQPLIGLYKSWVANMDEGWTRWLLEQYGFRFETLTDADIRAGDLSRFSAILLPDQRAGEILEGHAPGEMPAEYTGGVGIGGVESLRRYVRDGGTLVALDHAADFAIEQLRLPVRNVLREVPGEEFFIPGSLIRIAVDTSDPLAAGMREEAAAFFVRSQAFELEPADGEGAPDVGEVDVVARYAERDLLMSGWELGADRHIAGRAAVMRAPVGEGQVVLIGFRPQFRAQPRATFKLLFNALLGAASVTGPTSSTREAVGAAR